MGVSNYVVSVLVLTFTGLSLLAEENFSDKVVTFFVVLPDFGKVTWFAALDAGLGTFVDAYLRLFCPAVVKFLPKKL